MKKLFLIIWLLAFAATAKANVGFSGTLAYPNGSLINGSLQVQLARRGVRDICNGGRIVPTSTVTLRIVNGEIQNGNSSFPTSDCLDPFSAFYVRMYDDRRTLLFDTNLLIASTNTEGTLMEIGYWEPASLLPQAPITVTIPRAVLSGPTLTQTITQPAGTVYAIAGGALELRRITSAPSVSATNNARLYTDGTNILVSVNGSAYTTLVGGGGGGDVTGSGTTNLITKFSSASVITNSSISDTGTAVTINLNQNATSDLSVVNTTNGTNARALVRVGDANFDLSMIATKSSYTAVAGWASAAVLRSGSSSSTGLILSSAAGPISFQPAGTATQLTVQSSGAITFTGVAFAALGTPADGTIIYCSNCSIANPCAATGNGALAKRLNSVWVCN